MNGCLTCVPNSLTRFKAYFKEIPVVTEDFSKYLIDLRQMTFASFNKRADELFAAIGDAGLAYMKANEIGFKFIAYKRKGIWNWGNTDVFNSYGIRICRGSFKEVKNFILFRSMNDIKKIEWLQSVIIALQDSRYVYNAKRATSRTGIDVPASFNGLSPDYRGVTESVYNTFDIIYANSKKNADIKIELTGIRSYDEQVANEVAGIVGGTPELYVWHHLDDFNPVTGTCTMQLVLKEFHNKVIYKNAADHVGGAAVWSNFYGVAYK